MTPRHALAAVAVAVIWGANFVVIDAGLHDMPPLTFVALRFVAVLRPGHLPRHAPGRPVARHPAVGLFLSLGQFALLYLSLHLGMPPGLASLVVQAQVIFTVVIAAARPARAAHRGPAARGARRPGRARRRGRSAAPRPRPCWPSLLCLAGALSWATGNVVTRRVGTASGLSMTSGRRSSCRVPMFGLSPASSTGPRRSCRACSTSTRVTLASTAYTAYLCSVFGYGVWNSLLARYPTASVVPFTLLVPVSGIATAWLFRDERPTLGTVVGGVLLLLGVLVTAVGRRRRRGRGPGGSGRSRRLRRRPGGA